MIDLKDIEIKIKEILEKKENALAKKKMYENNIEDLTKQYDELIQKISKIKSSHHRNLLIIFLTYLMSAFINGLLTIQLSNLFEGFKFTLFSILKVVVLIIPFISHFSYYYKTKDERKKLNSYIQQKYKLTHDLFDYKNLLNFCNDKIYLCDESIKDLENLSNNNKHNSHETIYELIEEKEKTYIKK